MWVGNFYKLHTSSEISEEVSVQSMIFVSVKYMGFCAFFSDEYFFPRTPIYVSLMNVLSSVSYNHNKNTGFTQSVISATEVLQSYCYLITEVFFENSVGNYNFYFLLDVKSVSFILR